MSSRRRQSNTPSLADIRRRTRNVPVIWRRIPRSEVVSRVMDDPSIRLGLIDPRYHPHEHFELMQEYETQYYIERAAEFSPGGGREDWALHYCGSPAHTALRLIDTEFSNLNGCRLKPHYYCPDNAIRQEVMRAVADVPSALDLGLW